MHMDMALQLTHMALCNFPWIAHLKSFLIKHYTIPQEIQEGYRRTAQDKINVVQLIKELANNDMLLLVSN